ncbi:MAG: type II secretion system F family protein [Thermodesulfobacteriaceae bacterium]|nr:type II secretion system F family protein [Thermodesulfobacteriaceae bacterium]
MPIYKYKALRRDGTIVKGEIEVASLQDFFSYLLQEGLNLLSYKTKRVFLENYFRKIKRKELAEFCHNLSFLLSAGIPLLSALQDLKETTTNPLLKRKIEKIISEILKGNTLSEALKLVKIFPPIVVSLAKIGEETGRLDKTLEEASKHLYRVEEIIYQTKRAMIYPIFVFFAMSTALLFWFLYVLPKIISVFKEMQIRLPLSTLILIELVEIFQKYYPLVIGLPVFLFLLSLFLYKYPKTQDRVEKVLLKTPFIGLVKRANFLAFFFEYFSLLLAAGIDILRGFDIMHESLSTQLPKKIVLKIKEQVLKGFSLSSSLKEEKIFKPLDIRLITVGEETGRLPEQMKNLADHYFNTVQNLVQTLSKILEPALIVVAGVIFLIIVIALIGPIYELIAQIGKM